MLMPNNNDILLLQSHSVYASVYVYEYVCHNNLIM